MQLSLKDIFEENQEPIAHNFLTEGFWKDLAKTIAIGGPGAVKDVVAKKITGALEKTKDMPAKQALSLVQHMKAQGLSKAWGEDLDVLENELTKRIGDTDKKNDNIDTKKLLAALGLTKESYLPYKKRKTLYEVFEVFLKE